MIRDRERNSAHLANWLGNALYQPDAGLAYFPGRIEVHSRLACGTSGRINKINQVAKHQMTMIRHRPSRAQIPL